MASALQPGYTSAAPTRRPREPVCGLRSARRIARWPGRYSSGRGGARLSTADTMMAARAGATDRCVGDRAAPPITVFIGLMGIVLAW